MLFKKIIYLFLIVHCSLLIVHCFAQCGEERWDVKTLSDKDTVLINFDKIIKSNIHEQISLPKPEKIKKDLPRHSAETRSLFNRLLYFWI